MPCNCLFGLSNSDFMLSCVSSNENIFSSGYLVFTFKFTSKTAAISSSVSTIVIRSANFSNAAVTLTECHRQMG